jgi:hypothetical protein
MTLATSSTAPPPERTERSDRTLTAWLRLTRPAPPDPAAHGGQDGGRAVVDWAVLRRVRGVVAWAMALLVLLIAGLAFVASFDKISTYAVTEVAWPTKLRWVPPLLVDSFTFVGTLLIVWLGLSGRPRRTALAYGWLLVGLGTMASVVVNLHHAPASLAGRIVAGSPPIALLLAVEALVVLLRYVLSDLTAGSVAPRLPSLADPVPASPHLVPTAHADVMRLDHAPADARRAVAPPELTEAALPRPGDSHDAGASASAHTQPERTDAHPVAGGRPAPASAGRDEVGAQLRERITSIWADRERDGGHRLIGAELAPRAGHQGPPRPGRPPRPARPARAP